MKNNTEQKKKNKKKKIQQKKILQTFLFIFYKRIIKDFSRVFILHKFSLSSIQIINLYSNFHGF